MSTPTLSRYFTSYSKSIFLWIRSLSRSLSNLYDLPIAVTRWQIGGLVLLTYLNVCFSRGLAAPAAAGMRVASSAGIYEQIRDWAADWMDSLLPDFEVLLEIATHGLLEGLKFLFIYGFERFLVFSNPIHHPALNNLWFDTVVMCIILWPLFAMIQTITSMMGDSEGSYYQVLRRSPLAFFAILVYRPVYAFFISFFNNLTMWMMPTGYNFEYAVLLIESWVTRSPDIFRAFLNAAIASIPTFLFGLIVYVFLIARQLMLMAFFPLLTFTIFLWIWQSPFLRYARVMFKGTTWAIALLLFAGFLFATVLRVAESMAPITPKHSKALAEMGYTSVSSTNGVGYAVQSASDWDILVSLLTYYGAFSMIATLSLLVISMSIGSSFMPMGVRQMGRTMQRFQSGTGTRSAAMAATAAQGGTVYPKGGKGGNPESMNSDLSLTESPESDPLLSQAGNVAERIPGRNPFRSGDSGTFTPVYDGPISEHGETYGQKITNSLRRTSGHTISAGKTFGQMALTHDPIESASIGAESLRQSRIGRLGDPDEAYPGQLTADDVDDLSAESVRQQVPEPASHQSYIDPSGEQAGPDGPLASSGEQIESNSPPFPDEQIGEGASPDGEPLADDSQEGSDQFDPLFSDDVTQTTTDNDPDSPDSIIDEEYDGHSAAGEVDAADSSGSPDPMSEADSLLSDETENRATPENLSESPEETQSENDVVAAAEEIDIERSSGVSLPVADNVTDETLASALGIENHPTSKAEDLSFNPRQFAATTLSPGSPDHLSIDAATHFTPVDSAEQSEAREWIAETPTGEQMYVSLDDRDKELLETTAVTNELNRSLPDDAQVALPETNVDDYRAAVVRPVEDIPNPEGQAITKEEYLTTASTQILMGEDTLGGGLTTTYSGKVTPRHFPAKDISIDSPAILKDEDFWNSITQQTHLDVSHLEFDVDEEELREALRETAQMVDRDDLESRLRKNKQVSEQTAEKLLRNVEFATSPRW